MPSYVLDITVRGKDNASPAFASVGKNVGSLASTVGKVLVGGLALGGAAVAAFGLQAIQMGSDAAETKSKFNTVFKDMADSVGNWSDSVANSMGLTKAESKGMLASVQDLLVPFGFARDKAGDMSKQILTLAGDMASFNNLNTADVIKDINSALVGSTEPMNKYGVVLNVAAITTEALNMGLIKQGDELDNVSKATATLSLIMKSTTDAQGDLGRTQDSFANQLKQTKAAFADITTEIGENLIPIFLPLLQNFNAWTGEHLPKFVQGMKDGIADLKEKWDEDWGGMRTTVSTFGIELPKETEAMWKELTAIFKRGGEETTAEHGNFLTTTARKTSEEVIILIASFKNLFTAVSGLQRAFIGAWEGDEAFWRIGVIQFWNSLADAILGIVQIGFGVNVRNGIVSALNGINTALTDWGVGITKWWNDFWASLPIPAWARGTGAGTGSGLPAPGGVINPINIPAVPPATGTVPPATTPPQYAPGGGAIPVPPPYDPMAAAAGLTINVDARGASDPAAVEASGRQGVLAAFRAAGLGYV